MKRLFLFILVSNITYILVSQNSVTLQEESVVLPTYTVAPAEKNPIFFRGEAFQGASRHYYPLKMNDQYINDRIDKEWKMVTLENDYIELAVAPEIGGKLYYAKDKTNDYNFVYKNDVVKPSNIGMTGAWVSGGIEWCVLHHHRASTFLPMNYTTTENEDGSKTIWVGEYEPRHGMRWTIGITLFPDKSYFKVDGRIFNASPYTHSFLYWANVATHTNENYQAIFPPSAQLVTYHSKTDFSTWPISTSEDYAGSDFSDGVDISWWKNTKESNSFFVHELLEDFMGGYDHGKNAGTVHIGDHNIVRGAKLWQWGSGPRGQSTEARLTDGAGPYVEIMVGAYSDNQPDYSWIRPYEVKTWEQYWFPAKGIEGFKNANLNGAVNLEERTDNSVFLGYYSTQKVNNAIVVLRSGEEIVFEKSIQISPDVPFSETIKLTGNFKLTDLYTSITDIDNNRLLIDYQPVELEPVDKLPEEWKGYTAPEELETVEEIYLTGKRVEQFYAPRYDEMDWYMEALSRDPDDIRTNTAVGNHYLKNGDYNSARRYLSKAIGRLTDNYIRPSDCEALYLQGLTLKALELYDEAIDTLYRATWDYAYHSAAYFELAQISAMRNEFDNALSQIDESLSTNSRNNRTIALKTSILRRLGEYDKALQIINELIEKDPLDFRMKNEYYLTLKEGDKNNSSKSTLKALEKEMRGFDENYLDLAVGYINDGLLKEAEEVLLRFNGNNPMFDYYLGFIADKNGQNITAEKYFDNAAEKSVDYFFPHRLETIKVLNTALKYNPDDGKAYYYIGNILYEKQPETAIDNWKISIEHNPDLAVSFRNIGMGYYQHYNDIQNAILYYEKAIELTRDEAIYYTELDDLYELNNSPIEKRLNLFRGQNDVVKKRDDSFIRQIAVLTMAGQPDKAVEYLDSVEFTYREGSSRVRETVIDAQLMLGRKYFNNKEYDKALKHYLEAQIPEEEAAASRLGDRDIQVYYFIGTAYEALGDKAKADEFYRKSANKNSETLNATNYYQGLSLEKLGNSAEAKRIFESMIEQADNNLKNESEDLGVKFGGREASSVRSSRYYTTRGLGYKGLNNTKQAGEDLRSAAELSHSNLWANTELNDF